MSPRCPSVLSFGMKVSPASVSITSTTGCRPSTMRSVAVVQHRADVAARTAATRRGRQKTSTCATARAVPSRHGRRRADLAQQAAVQLLLAAS